MTDSLWIPQNRESLSQETLKTTKEVLNKIPQLSLSVQKIIEMARDEKVDSNQLANVASSDPVLVSKILMMVNSTYFGLTHKIDNLRLAIVLLGFNEIRNIAVQCGVMQTIRRKTKGEDAFDTKELLRHSYLVSVCAEMLSKEDDPKLAGVFMTMGILHDIGKFALNAIDMNKYPSVKQTFDKRNSPDIPLLSKEEKVFGLNHAIIGGMLAEKWNLSERICVVIEYHHFPSFFGINDIKSEYIEDITLICFADLIVNIITGEKKGLIEPHPLFFDVLGTNPPIDNLITEEIRLKLSKAKEIIESLL